MVERGLTHVDIHVSPSIVWGVTTGRELRTGQVRWQNSIVTLNGLEKRSPSEEGARFEEKKLTRRGCLATRT